MSSLWALPQEQPDADEPASPYFTVISTDKNPALMPLKETRVQVDIAGVIANVQITQLYQNTGDELIEAIYVFPGSTRSALYHMQMTIGERTLTAEIREKQKAREEYEQAREEGRTASLLEQERPNVFSMNVANILPGDLIRVDLRYTELLIPEKGSYEFVFPTVVGPRYHSPSAQETGNKTIDSPHGKEWGKPKTQLFFDLKLEAGMPVQDIRCSSHDMDISSPSPTERILQLPFREKREGNRDIVIQYELAGKKVESGLLLYEGAEENFFLAMLQPPRNIESSEMPPREYILIMDVSGSMYGFPLDISKKLMRNLLSHFRPQDRFNIMLFAGSSRMYADQSVPATEENIEQAMHFVDQQQGGGGTELLPALKKALSLNTPDSYSRSFIIATDGYVTVEQEAFDLIRQNLDKANFFPFGIGSSVNRYLIEGLAHTGMGLPFIITDEKEANAIAMRFREYISRPVLSQLKASFEGMQVYDLEPVSLPDLLGERPVLIYGKYKGKARGKIQLQGSSGKQEYRQTVDVSKFKAKDENIALKYLWARDKIRMLDDYNRLDYRSRDYEKELTQLGLKYHLLTAYTSFIAVDSEIRNTGDQGKTVHQVLPLPHGVSQYATGSSRVKSMAANVKAPFKRVDAEEVIMIVEDEIELDVEEMNLQTETPAAYPGRLDLLIEKIRKHLLSENIPSRPGMLLKLSFTVQVNGNLSDFKVLESANNEVDKAVIAFLKKEETRWIPATQKGVNKASDFVLTIQF